MNANHVRLTVLSTLSALVLAAVPAVAGEGQARDPEARFTKIVAHADKNGDGILQVSELPGRMAKRLGGADANRDGVITQAEFTAHATVVRQERLARLDTNKDGKVSDEERAAARARMAEKRFSRSDKNADGQLEPGEVGAKRWEHIAVADTDKSGTVSAAEMQQAVANGTLKGGHRHHRGGDKSRGS
jgi:hypothetical protein